MNLIVATTRQGVIGHDNKMLWWIPDELKQFRDLTINQPVIMGKSTLLSIGNFLNLRTNYVMTHTKDSVLSHGCHLIDESDVPNLPQDSWVIGGVQIYTYFLEQGLIDTAYVSYVNKDVTGNKIFPLHMLAGWKQEFYTEHKDFTTIIYRKFYD